MSALENATCPICESEGAALFTQRDLFCGLDGEFGQRYCAGCGVYFLSPRVPESRIGDYYPDVYAPYQKRSYSKLAGKAASALGLDTRRQRIVERFVQRGRILDVGCGSGEFLEGLARGPWQRYAMDTKWYGRYGLPDGFHEGRFDHEPPPFADLDAITLWHVFEHLYHPQQALDNAATLLRPGGFLFLAIPDLKCVERLLFRKYWVGWDPPRHIATYSANAIEVLLRRAGLRQVAVVPDACTGELLSLNMEFFLRSRGIRKDIHRSLLLRALLSPFVFASIRLGLAPAKVYVAQK
ncbi:MAG TPA: class I SAM-dependent methyltransferase [Bryobacteraceae bacterium]